jgi:F-type H+-transporting ATPase subunit gamma
MANTRAIKRRIRTIASVQKTTNAMQLVAASKMRRAQARAVAAKPYVERMRGVLADLAAARSDGGDEAIHPLLATRQVQHVTLIVVSPNRGLCGGLPGNLQRAAGAFLLGRAGGSAIVAVGKKGRDFFARARGNIIAEFIEMVDYPSLADTLPITRIAIDDYEHERTDAVFIVYSQFVNTVTQRPVVQQVLPIADVGEPDPSRRVVQYIFEPSPAEVLEELLPRYVEMQIYNAILQNAASEQSARMVAMRNATDAARDMIDSLTLALNKARQDQITSELLDIVGGAAAITG